MITKQFHFKDYNSALPKINSIKTIYNVFTHLTKSDENGLIVTIEIDENNLQEHLNLIESFGLETY